MTQEIGTSELLNTWASDGAKVEPVIEKIMAGWLLGEQPPHEFMNYLQNLFGAKLNHILKYGIPLWNENTEYEIGSPTQFDGDIWFAVTENTDSEPSDINTDWRKLVLDIEDGSITEPKLADNAVTNAKLAFDGGALGYRNKIIGGDFTTNPWQRGVSFTAVANGAYTADRWEYQKVGAVVHTITKATDAPTASQAGIYTGFSLGLAVTTADSSIAAGDFCTIGQNVEGLNSASFGFGQAGARFVTLSFWVTGAKTGAHCVAIRNSGKTRSYVAEYTINTANTWEYKTITIPVDTAGTWLYDNGLGLSVVFTLSAGTTFQTTANTWTAGNFLATSSQVNETDTIANNFKVALVQLESGQTATAFEARSVGQEELLCYRYFWRLLHGINMQQNANGVGSNIYSNIWYTVPMRAVPTITTTFVGNANISTNSINSSSVLGFVIISVAAAAGSSATTYQNGNTATAELSNV